MNLYYLLGISALVTLVKGQDPVVCDRQWVKVGCFKDSLNPRPFPEMLINDRDPHSKFNDGKNVLNWHKWSESVHSLACRCMEKAREKGYNMFALQFYGECWSGPNAETKYNKDGNADTCIMNLKPPYSCDKEQSHECVGAQSTNYVYRIDETQVGTKDVDGGFSEWSEWTRCSKTCGGGSQSRERTCTNPPPEGKGRPCVPRLGEPEEARSCNIEPCSACKSPMDVGLIVDSSSSVRRKNFDNVKKFLIQFAGILKKLDPDTHVSLIRYNHYSDLMFNFNDHQNDLMQQLAKLDYKPGGTRTDKALEVANYEVFTQKGGARPNVPHVLLVVTDGRTNSRSKPYSEVLAPLMRKNTRIIAVGVGKNIGRAELETIALGHKEKVIMLKSFVSLVQDIKEIEKVFCRDTINF